MFQFWGATTDEINSVVVGDDLCSNATLIATRSITISAPPQDVFVKWASGELAGTATTGSTTSGARARPQ
jgi:hypothetical protein